MKKVLIMGLPGAGKTWLAERLQKEWKCAWYNADKVRSMANDWDFSEEARFRQAYRMKNIADYEVKCARLVICDFVCPLEETRIAFDADITIWVDTLQEGRFADTNKMFEAPDTIDANVWHVDRYLSDEEIKLLAKTIIKGEQ
jgi:adenylylsulfate kinase|tara:strand:- start:15077 stop:15505 length:429 start_codon:yes stop_codon:yes gene_type:complete